MIAIVHSIYSQSVHAPALDAELMDNDAERYCITMCSFKAYYHCNVLCTKIADGLENIIKNSNSFTETNIIPLM